MRYDKLVRDKIPDIIKSEGRDFTFRIAGLDEYPVKLIEKLQEEVKEYLDSHGSLEELADIMEVVYALANSYGISNCKLDEIRMDKRKRNGGFERKIILEEIK
jgi:predicted house-cleaning noncanonical NTP pyrophosphatase (MazG superfamily)